MPKLGLGLGLPGLTFKAGSIGTYVPLLWTPSEITTEFWYDPSDASTVTATGNTVNSVADKSGNNLTLAPQVGFPAPLYRTRSLNGLDTLEWTGDNCLENITFTHDHSTTPLNIALIVYMEGDPANPNYDSIFSLTPTTNPRLYLRRYLDRWQLLITGSIAYNQKPPTVLTNTPTIVNARLNGTNTYITSNGETSLQINAGSDTITNLRFGHNEAESLDLRGFFAEIVGYTDNTQQDKVEGYLAWKWGLQANLPVDHPYKTAAP